MVSEILSATHFFRQIVINDFALLPPLPPTNSENQNFEKNEETPGDTIILQISNINDNHMRYGS